MTLNLLLVYNVFLIPILTTIYTYMRINLLDVKSFKTQIEGLKYNFIEPVVSLRPYFLAQLSALTIILHSCNFNLQVSGLMLFKSLSLSYISILFWIICLYYVNLKELNNHWLVGLHLNILVAPLILFSNDFIMLYVVIELNAYIFLYICITQVFVLNTSQRFSVVNSAIISFVLNFFSSIFFFLSISFLYYYNSFLFDNHYMVLLLFFFLIKISLGPWLYIGVEVYKGLFFDTLLIYTLVFCLVVLPKFLTVFAGISVSFGFILSFFILGYGVFLVYSINIVTSLKVFLSYSTSIVTTYLLLTLVFLIN